MSTRFKLPCDQCAQVHAISPAQAGETLSCACGHSIQVPTLREIRLLEPTERPDRERASSDWNLQRGLLFVGGALLLAIAALTTWSIWPQRQALVISQPAFQEINFDVQQLNPNEAWDAWQHLRQQTLEVRTTPEYLDNRKKYRELSYILYAAWAGAAIGLSMIGASLLWPALRPSAAQRPSA